MAPQLSGVAGLSREGADWRCADGVRAAIDSLRPGIQLVTTFGAWPSKDTIQLSGREVSVSYGNGTLRMGVEYELPAMTLVPFATYRLWLAGGSVEVTSLG